MFVSLEGLDGSGKSTLAQELTKRLESAGIDVALTREPGATEVGRDLRGLLLSGPEIGPEAELFLFLADRAENIRQIVTPNLAAGRVVVCDRHGDSTLAYQGYGRGLNVDQLRALNQFATVGVRPDLTILIDLEVEVALKRQTVRNRLGSESPSFYQKVREGFLSEADREPNRWLILDGSLSVDELGQLASNEVLRRRALQNV